MRKSFFMRAGSYPKGAGPAWTQDGGRLRALHENHRGPLQSGAVGWGYAVTAGNTE